MIRKKKKKENKNKLRKSELNYRESFLKVNLSKFTILSNFVDSQDLSKQLLNLVILLYFNAEETNTPQ